MPRKSSHISLTPPHTAMTTRQFVLYFGIPWGLVACVAVSAILFVVMDAIILLNFLFDSFVSGAKTLNSSNP